MSMTSSSGLNSGEEYAYLHSWEENVSRHHSLKTNTATQNGAQ